jgi:hypothetical protein
MPLLMVAWVRLDRRVLGTDAQQSGCLGEHSGEGVGILPFMVPTAVSEETRTWQQNTQDKPC